MDNWIQQLVNELHQGDESAVEAELQCFQQRAQSANPGDWGRLTLGGAELITAALTGRCRPAAFAAAAEILFPRSLAHDRATAGSVAAIVGAALRTPKAARAAAQALAAPWAFDAHQTLKIAFDILAMCLRSTEVRLVAVCA